MTYAGFSAAFRTSYAPALTARTATVNIHESPKKLRKNASVENAKLHTNNFEEIYLLRVYLKLK